MRAKTGVLCHQHQACARTCRQIWPLRPPAPADFRRLLGRSNWMGARLVPLSLPRLEPIDRTREKSHFHRRLGGRLPHSERAGGRAGPHVQHAHVAVAVCRPDLARWTLRHRHDPIGNRCQILHQNRMPARLSARGARLFFDGVWMVEALIRVGESLWLPARWTLKLEWGPSPRGFSARARDRGARGAFPRVLGAF